MHILDESAPAPAPGAGEGTRNAEESVLSALMSIGRLMRQRVAGEEMDPATFWLLKGLAGHGALRVTELAALANLDASTVSRHVQQLHRSGLVDRSADPSDGRAQRVALSTRGRNLLDAGLARRRAVLTRSFDGWSRSDVDTLDTLLARFVSDLTQQTELEQA